jgi:hypothetical protein
MDRLHKTITGAINHGAAIVNGPANGLCRKAPGAGSSNSETGQLACNRMRPKCFAIQIQMTVFGRSRISP